MSKAADRATGAPVTALSDDRKAASPAATLSEKHSFISEGRRQVGTSIGGVHTDVHLMALFHPDWRG